MRAPFFMTWSSFLIIGYIFLTPKLQVLLSAMKVDFILALTLSNFGSTSMHKDNLKRSLSDKPLLSVGFAT